MEKEEILSKIKEEALQKHVPIIEDEPLELIKVILKLKKPNKILEVGTAVGYSAINFSKYLVGENAQIVRYDLKSVSFSLEGVRIPAFVGKITIKINGTKTMADFANMLVEFGTYSGVGIKTALGMGCIRQLKERG